jgi:hypothetical protein
MKPQSWIGFAGAVHITQPPKDFNDGALWCTIDPGDNTSICHWVKGIQDGPVDNYKNCLLDIPTVADGFKKNVIIEDVELWGGSSISFASASSGDLFKLAFEVGALIYQFRKNHFPVYIVSPRIWKGQLNYIQLRHILLEKFHIETKNDHEASAIGIGLWAKCLF